MATNCPAFPAYDPQAPVTHDEPVHHAGSQLTVSDYPDDCLLAQLQWERKQAGRGIGSPGYLENLEGEWSRRDLCSRCLRDLDHPFMTEVDKLEHRLLVAQGKLRRISAALGRLGDAELRATLSAILAEPGERENPGPDIRELQGVSAPRCRPPGRAEIYPHMRTSMLTNM